MTRKEITELLKKEFNLKMNEECEEHIVTFDDDRGTIIDITFNEFLDLFETKKEKET